MNWTMEQLRAFAAAAEEGSFSAAGRKLGRAQSVVSTHIAMLEDTLGVELFDRSSRSPVLTEAGRDLLPEAHAVLQQSSRFDARAIAQYKGEAAEFNVAISHGVPFQSVSESISAMLERHPFLGGSFEICTPEQVWRRVGGGESQVGIVLGDEPRTGENCDISCLGQMQYCAVASRRSPLGSMRRIRKQDLAQYRQILFSKEERQFLLSSSYWVVSDVLCAMYWAALGIGWTVIPHSLARRISRDVSMKDLAILDLDSCMPAAGNIYLIWNMEFKKREVIDFFRADLMRRYGLLARSDAFF